MSASKTIFNFFVDGKQFEAERNALSGAEIKAKANVPVAHQLILNGESYFADKPVLDGESVYVEGRVKKFYTMPAARVRS